MKRFLFAICCICFVGSASAAMWSDFTSITTIYPWSNGNTEASATIYVQFSQTLTAAGCRTDANGLVALKKDNVLFREIYTLIPSAQAQGKQVRYYVDGCDSANWPVLQHMQLQ